MSRHRGRISCLAVRPRHGLASLWYVINLVIIMIVIITLVINVIIIIIIIISTTIYYSSLFLTTTITSMPTHHHHDHHDHHDHHHLHHQHHHNHHHIIANPGGGHYEHALLLCASAIVTASLASFALALVMIVVIVGARSISFGSWGGLWWGVTNRCCRCGVKVDSCPDVVGATPTTSRPRSPRVLGTLSLSAFSLGSRMFSTTTTVTVGSRQCHVEIH